MMSDLRFAVRQLAAAPGFAAVALLTLAVGIGSATVVFSAINAFLFKPLPHVAVPEERLVYATQTDRGRGHADAGWNFLDYAAVRARSATLAGLWIHSDFTALLGGGERPERIRGTQISVDAFSLLGLRPLHGRLFTEADAEPGGPVPVLLAASLWQSRFGGRTDLVGQSVVLNGQPAVVAGILPAGWRYPDLTELWVPLRPEQDKLGVRGYFSYSGRALLRPGVPLAAAQAELDTIAGALAAEFPATNAGVGIRLRPIREEAVEDTREFTFLLFGAVLFVFLIACVNVANLLLARAVGRTKEIAVRLALGAPRRRIVRQLLLESLVLAAAGGLGGLILALWGNDAVAATIPVDLPFWLRFEFDGRVFLFVAGLSVIAALAFGLVPALRISRPDVVSALKEGGRSAATDGPRATRLRHGLVVLEVALALVLLVGAGLMMRSMLELRRLHPGFDAGRVLTFRTGWPADLARTDPAAPARFFAAVLGKLSDLPGVEAAALTNWLPGRSGPGPTASVYLASGQPPSRSADALPVLRRLASPEFFSALGIPLLAGRTFDAALDRADSPPVVVVDEAFAVRHFGTPAAALGARVAEHVAQPKPDTVPVVAQIVGVVGSIRHHLDRDDDPPTLYSPHSQWRELFQSVVLRTAGDPARFAPLVREAMLEVSREIPIYDVFTLEEVLLRGDTVWPRRFFGFLFTLFGGVALFLACIGIHGVMTCHVTQRRQELGVRLALGASPRAIVRLVVGQGFRLVAGGLALGLVAAAALARLLAGVLYGVSPHDPPTFAFVPLLLAAVALGACWLSSRRASVLAPSAALRAP